MGEVCKPPIHGRDHCPGGADPIPCLSSGGVTPAEAWLRWNQSTVDISPGDWTGIKAADPFQQDYAEGWISDPNDFDLTIDLETGIITWDLLVAPDNLAPLVIINVWTWISDTTWATGDVIGVGVNLGSAPGTSFSDSHRYFNAITVGSDTGLPDDQHLNFCMVFPSALNFQGFSAAKPEIYQASSGDKNFSDVVLSVTALRNSAGTFFP